VEHKPEPDTWGALGCKLGNNPANGSEAVIRAVDGELALGFCGLPGGLAFEDAACGLQCGGGVLREPEGEGGELVSIAAAGQDRVTEVGSEPASEALSAGWLRWSRSAALVTLRSVMRASSEISRLRSRRESSTCFVTAQRSFGSGTVSREFISGINNVGEAIRDLDGPSADPR